MLSVPPPLPKIFQYYQKLSATLTRISSLHTKNLRLPHYHYMLYYQCMENSSAPTKAYDLLEERERKIVDEYLQYAISTQKNRGERIALALSYPISSEHVKYSRGLLAKPLVRVALAEKIQEAADEEDLNPQRVIREHASIAFSNLQDFIETQPFGDFTLKNISEIPREKMAAVKSIKAAPTINGMRTEIHMHDKIQSLKILAELMGLVAPDAPPVLEEYTSKALPTDAAATDAPEEEYARLLEQI